MKKDKMISYNQRVKIFYRLNAYENEKQNQHHHFSSTHRERETAWGDMDKGRV